MQITESQPIILNFKSKKHKVMNLLEFFLVSYLHWAKGNNQISFFHTNRSTFPLPHFYTSIDTQ